jgi:predicted DCC family thiol-disulfide oxidoreductase YuxK
MPKDPQEEINFEQFQEELDQEFFPWISRQTRSRRSWHMAMAQWALGDR